MAHTSEGKGPYHDRAGEFCGNWRLNSPAMRCGGESQRDAERHLRKYLARVRFGKPSPCALASSEEMAAMGWVGLYLKEDRNLFDWETAVDTDELHEDCVSKVGSPKIRVMQRIETPNSTR